MYRKKKRHLRRPRPNFLGQHFLRSQKIAREIVRTGKLLKNDFVLDIGAGAGILTSELAQKARKVWAIEYDAQLAKQLRAKFADQNHVKVIEADFLQISLPRKPFVVIASIPYAITTAIFRKLLQPKSFFQKGVFVIEKGAAIRLTAKPIVRPEILSWRIMYDFQRGRTIAPKFFSPPPKVLSSVLKIQRKKEIIVAPEHQGRFLALVKYGLKYPRAPVEYALRGVFTAKQITRLIRVLQIEREMPICCLKESQWGVVFQTMRDFVPKFRWPK